MPRSGLNGIIGWLRRSVLAHVSCGELLERFIARSQPFGLPNDNSRDSKADDAFAELVRRHGPKVYGVCRRILGDHQLAEDAFQAAFVVLSRKASSIHPRSAVGGYLYVVARQAALKALAMSRRRKESLVARPPDAAASGSPSHESDVLAMLDEEIANLKDAHRAAVVMCELDGVGRAEAAKQLGISEGTLSSRLSRAREQLRKRLLKRGVSLSAGMLAALSESAQAVVPFGMTAAAEQITASAVSQSVSLIAHGVLKTMILTKVKTVTMFGASLVLTSGLGISLLAARDGQGGQKPKSEPIAEQKAAIAEPIPPKPVQEADARTDVHGDPLPAGALNRLGTLRQRAADSHLAVSADGKEIITVGSTMTVRIWDAATGKLRSLTQLPNDRTYYSYLSPHGKYFLHDSYHPQAGRQLVIWDVARGKVAYTQHFHKDKNDKFAWFERAAFSADESQVAVAANESGNHSIRVWNLGTGKMRTLHEYTKVYTAWYFNPVVQFSPDGNTLVAVQRDKSMRCWDLTTDKLVWDTPFHQPFFCFSPDSKTIALGNSQRLDAATGKPNPWKVKPPEQAIPIAFSPDGRQLAFVTMRESYLIWEIESGKTVLEIPKADRQFSGLRMPSGPPTDFAFTPDGSGFIWGLNALQRWTLADGKTVFPETREWGHTGIVSKVVFSSDGKWLASTGQNDRVLLWDVATARPRFAVPGGSDRMLAFTPSTKQILAPHAGEKDGVGAWDLASGKLANVFEWTDWKNGMFTTRMFSSANEELRVTSDGSKVMMLVFENGRDGDDSILTIWDSKSGKCLRQERVPWTEDSVLTPDGASVLVFAPRKGNVESRALDTGELRWQLPQDDFRDPRFRPSGKLALSPDGRLMAVHYRFDDHRTGESAIGGICVGDMATGRKDMKLDVDKSALFAFSPDNRLFAVATAEGVRFWEIASHKQAGFIPAPNRNAIPPGEAFASALAFAPDSRTLATGHADCTILLWDATFRDGAARGPVSEVERDSLWTILAGDDAVRAQAAGWRFVDDAKTSAAFLKNHFASLTVAPADTMQQLLRDLDSDQFKLREAAEKQLRALGDRAEPRLRQVLKEKLSLEATRRVEAILTIIDPPPPFTGERLRVLRAVQILERIDSTESRQLLSELSAEMRPTWLMRAATESLARMKPR